jgi:hypothetical protein
MRPPATGGAPLAATHLPQRASDSDRGSHGREGHMRGLGGGAEGWGCCPGTVRVCVHG